ncbi:hypothetical protein [Streptomyces avicenniae]|uniref:hypothetical protein n=1 Tax=Streptomyces avicenniae TaxID=500153 RepID=UPI000B03B3D4|nr:hypothetical protein [Streptomyces avicenniae]
MSPQGAAADPRDGLDDLFDAPVAAGLRAYWVGRGVTVRAQAEPWRRYGHSGALLGLVVLGHADRGDERIVVKVLPAGPDTRETDRHDEAYADAPEFTEAHVVAQAYPPYDLPDDGRRVMFQRLPPAAAEVMPLGAALNGELAVPCGELVTSLLASWNPDRALRSTTVGEFLTAELRSAMEPGRSARAWAGEVLMADVGAGPWIRDEDEPDVILPNPALITAPGNPVGGIALDCFTGRTHGDLHLENVLVAQRLGRPLPGHHWLIDLAHYAQDVPLSRDTAALVLALAARRVADPGIGAGEARALIDVVVDPRHPAGPGIGAGVVDAIRAVDAACEAELPGDRAVWRAQYLWSVVAGALVHTSYEAAGERARWWYSRLAAHAARAALREAAAREPGALLPTPPAEGAIPVVGPRTAAEDRDRRTSAPLLRTRAEVVASVRGRALLPDELPFFTRKATLTPEEFVPRPEGDQLPLGVVLLSPPGTGRSRWCLEVAERAERAGGPVLFLGGIDGGPAELLPVSTDMVVGELAEALDRDAAPQDGAAPAASRTALLVIDGLDRFPGLDLPGLHDALVELAYRGRPVAVLATSRQGSHWNSQQSRGAAALLPVEKILPYAPEHRRPLLRAVLRATAPRAMEALGGSALQALLGNDPAAPLAPGAAAMWSGLLERAAGEAGPEGGVSALVAEPLPEAVHRVLQGAPCEDAAGGRLVLLPMAAVLAAAPLPEARLAAVADAALHGTASALELAAPRGGAEIVRCLREIGLLSPAGASADDVLAVPHPLACDVFLAYATRRGGEGPGLDQVLDAVGGDAGAIANTAASVARWYPVADTRTRERFDEQAGLWLEKHVRTLGLTLAAADPGGGSVLEFLLYTRPWHNLTYVHWSDLAGPWFERATASRVDPTLLARALYEDRNEDRSRIIGLALGWLERHAEEQVAAPVLRWLLRRHETRGTVRDRALALADRFLRANPDVRPNHVLAAALVQHGTDPGRTGPLAARALAELREEPGAETNAPLLAVLLSRRDTEERVLDEALGMATAHLARHPLAPSSNEVLKWLLVRQELPAAEHRAVMATADAWLAANGGHPHAAHVLSGVWLDARGTAARRRTAAALAVDWLEAHWRRRPAIWVLTDLMYAHTDHAADTDPELDLELIPDALRPRIAAVTVTWLQHWEREDVTPDTVAKVLRLTRRTPAARELAQAMLVWVRKYAGMKKAFPALSAVLDVSDQEPSLAAEAVGTSLKWLKAHGGQVDATVVLQKLLRVDGLKGDEARAAYGHTLSWLDAHFGHATDVHVARWLLLAFKRQAPEPEQLAAAVTHVLALLDRLQGARSVSPAALNVHLPMLRAALERQPDPEQTELLLDHAWLLLVNTALSGQRGMLLQSLLGPRSLPADFVARVVAFALPWLDALAGTEQAGYALKGLVRRKEIRAGTKEFARVCAAARVWLAAFPEHPEAGSLAARLLLRDGADAQTRHDAIDAATAWLATGPGVAKAAPVLSVLLPVTPPGDDRAAAFAWGLLREGPPWQRKVQLLSGLLRCPAVTGQAGAQAREDALSLVADHHYERHPGILMQALLERDDLDEQQERDVMEHARGWWNHHHELASSPYLAAAMFARPRRLRLRLGHRTWEERMVDDLVDWLGAEPSGVRNGTRGSLPTAVRLVVERRPSPWQKREIAERVDAWLTARPGDPEGPELARTVVALVDEAHRADPFGAGLGVEPDVLDRLRAAAREPDGEAA